MVVAVVSSLGAPLIPTIATDEHVFLADAQWTLTITMLVGAIATPTMGRLGDGPHRRDVVGAVLLGAALGGLLLVLSEAEVWGWTSPRVIGIGAAGLMLLAVWVRQELRTPHPLVDLRMVRNRLVLTAHATGAFAGM